MTTDESDEFPQYSGSDLPFADPPPDPMPPGMQWHPRIGLFPIGCDPQIELQCLRQRLRDEEQGRRWRAEADERERKRVAALPPPPPTLEERVAELERQVAHLQGRKPRRKAA